METTPNYPIEIDVNGEDVMPDNVSELADAVIGHRIVAVEQVGGDGFITLDNGKRVILRDSGDCCAYTELEQFLLHPDKVDHMILGVGTTDNFTTWHVYADWGDVLELTVGWSAGSGYYGYGFTITVEEQEDVS